MIKHTSITFNLEKRRTITIAVKTDEKGGAYVVYLAKNGNGRIIDRIETYNYQANLNSQ